MGVVHEALRAAYVSTLQPSRGRKLQSSGVDIASTSQATHVTRLEG